MGNPGSAHIKRERERERSAMNENVCDEIKKIRVFSWERKMEEEQ